MLPFFSVNKITNWKVIHIRHPRSCHSGFSIYINDLPLSSSKLTFCLFADDNNIYIQVENLYQLQRGINKELKNVKIWLEVSKLSLNIEV